jgi:hypothetical protein
MKLIIFAYFCRLSAININIGIFVKLIYAPHKTFLFAIIAKIEYYTVVKGKCVKKTRILSPVLRHCALGSSDC